MSPPADTTSSPADIASSPADTTSSPTSSPETTPPGIITFTIQADPLHLQPGVIGRGTSVLPVEPPSDPKYKDLPQELVAKISWPPEDRLGEDVIIAHIRSLITPRWKKHIPDVRGSLTQTMKDVKSPRTKLTDIARHEIERWKADVRTQNGDLTADELEDAQLYNAFIGDAHENRIFRTLICVRYTPLQEVRNCQEFAKVFLDVVQVHYVVYTEAHILHRDLSVGNIMFRRENDGVIGVLNDWDLAIPLEPYALPGPSSKHRTGTAAFMALELLGNKGAPIKHEYRHDLESFGWILIWCTFVLDFQGKVVPFKELYAPIQEWTDTVEWATLKSRKFEFVMQGVNAHHRNITKAMAPLTKRWTKKVFRGMGKTLAYETEVRDEPEEDDEDAPDADLLPGVSSDDDDKEKVPAPEFFFTFDHFMDVLLPHDKNNHVEVLELQSTKSH